MTSPRGLLIPAVLILAACRGAQGRSVEATPAARPALPADVQDVGKAVASSGDDRKAAQASEDAHLDVSGELASPMQSDLGAKITGRVGEVRVEEGERIRKGEVLLVLETEYLRLDVARAEAEVDRAKAIYEDARRELTRKQGLLPKGSVSQAVFDRAQAGFDQAKAALAAAEAAAGLARQRLADASLVSPVDGVVVSRRADVGEKLGESTIAFVVAQTMPLKLRFRVPERYLAKVRPGRAVRATVDPYPGETFAGKVTLVGGSVDPSTRTFAVEAEVANRDGRLLPGLFARVELDLLG